MPIMPGFRLPSQIRQAAEQSKNCQQKFVVESHRHHPVFHLLLRAPQYFVDTKGKDLIINQSQGRSRGLSRPKWLLAGRGRRGSSSTVRGKLRDSRSRYCFSHDPASLFCTSWLNISKKLLYTLMKKVMSKEQSYVKS